MMKYLSTNINMSLVKGHFQSVNMLALPPYPLGLSTVPRGHSSSKMLETFGAYGNSVLMISSVSEGDTGRAVTDKLQG